MFIRQGLGLNWNDAKEIAELQINAFYLSSNLVNFGN